MTDENNNKNELNPAEDNPWVKFLWLMTELDKTSENPDGWYWLIGLYYLLGIKIPPMQDRLPDEHPLKSAPLPKESEEQELEPIISELKERLGNPKEITEIDFSNLEFKNFVNFSNLIFPINVTFSNSKFQRKVEFNYTEFFLFVNFNYTEFCIFAEFNGTRFSSTVQFFKAQLSIAEFQKTVFNGFANFSDTAFLKMANFRGAIFSHQVRFNTAKFLGYTTFEESTFKLHAPKFYGAELNDEMFWNDIKLPTLEWTNDEETKENYKKRIKNNENAYENLSTKLGNQKKYRDELFFFRQELRCQRKLAESFLSLCAFWLYEIFSDYGYRIGRVFGWWLGHIVFGAVVIAFIASVCGDVRFHQNLPCAISVSVANANPYAFFGFESSSLKTCYTELDKLAPISFAVVKATQTVIGIALLSLLIITLRTRFRLK